jgi:hypothetical protein
VYAEHPHQHSHHDNTTAIHPRPTDLGTVRTHQKERT